MHCVQQSSAELLQNVESEIILANDEYKDMEKRIYNNFNEKRILKLISETKTTISYI